MSLKAIVCSSDLKAEVCSIADSGIQRVSDSAAVEESYFVFFEKNSVDEFGVSDDNNLTFFKNVGLVQRNPFGCAILGSNVLGRSCTDDNLPIGSELVVLEDSVSVYRFDGTDNKEYLVNDTFDLLSDPVAEQERITGDSTGVTDSSFALFGKKLNESQVVSDENFVELNKTVLKEKRDNSLGSFILGSEELGSNYYTKESGTPVYMEDSVSYSLVVGLSETVSDSFGFNENISVELTVSLSDGIGTDDLASPWRTEEASDSISFNENVVATSGMHLFVDDSIYPIYDSPVEYEHKHPTGDEAMVTDIVSVQLYKYGTLGTRILGSKILG